MNDHDPAAILRNILPGYVLPLRGDHGVAHWARVTEIGLRLAVEQFRPCPAQRRHQPGQRHLAGIAAAAEHRFAAEHPVKPDTVKPARQLALVPAFDRMGMAQPVHHAVGFGDPPADPRLVRVGAGGSAFFQNAAESRVAGNGKAPLPQHLGQRTGADKAVQRQDRPALWLYPEHLWIVARIGHGEIASAVGHQQRFGIDDRGHEAALANLAAGGERAAHKPPCFPQNLRLLACPARRSVAQLVEHRSPKPRAVGSSPSTPASYLITRSRRPCRHHPRATGR